MLRWHRNRHSNKWRRYLYLLVPLFLGIGSFLFHNCTRALCICSFNTCLSMPQPSHFFSCWLLFARASAHSECLKQFFPFSFLTLAPRASNPKGSRYSHCRVEQSLCFKARLSAKCLINRVPKWWRHKNEICEIMGFVKIFWKNNVQDAYLPKISNWGKLSLRY